MADGVPWMAQDRVLSNLVDLTVDENNSVDVVDLHHDCNDMTMDKKTNGQEPASVVGVGSSPRSAKPIIDITTVASSPVHKQTTKRPSSLSVHNDVVFIKKETAPKRAAKRPVRPLPPATTTENDSPAPSVKKCPICLGAFDKPASTVCGHVFCTACIRQVLRTTRLCPVCRKRLPVSKPFHAIYL